MKYTFLMPAYKTDYLQEAIQSILNQTYSDFQLIISDDCSPYDVENVVRGFNDSRIIFRRNKENIGGKDLVAHWNLMLSLANSDFIILAPDDDFYSEKFLEEINKLHESHPDVDVLKCRAQDIDASGNPYKQDLQYPEIITQIENIKFQFSKDVISGIGQYVFRRTALLAIGGFVNYPVAWWSDVITHIKLSANGMAVTKDILFSFRHFDGNISSHKSRHSERIAKTNATLMFCNDIKQLLNEINPKEDYRFINENLKTSKLKWIYSSASVTPLSKNIYLMNTNPDIFNSWISKIRLLRYWLTKDWIVKIITVFKR